MYIRLGVSAVLFNVGKIITYLVGTGNFSIKSAKYPDMAPVTLFRTLNVCSDSPTSQLQCPLIAGSMMP